MSPLMLSELHLAGKLLVALRAGDLGIVFRQLVLVCPVFADKLLVALGTGEQWSASVLSLVQPPQIPPLELLATRRTREWRLPSVKPFVLYETGFAGKPSAAP